MGSMEMDFGVKVEVPEHWRESLDANEAVLTEKKETSRFHAEVLLVLDHLRSEPAPSWHWPLHLERGQVAGPYLVDFLCKEHGLVLDLDGCRDHTSKAMRHRHLRQLQTPFNPA